MQAEILLYVIIFLYGIVIGSFLNVLIYRLPNKENISTTRSHCMSCGHKLSWYDLVPLLSWLSLGGRCRYCKGKISIQYPLIESLNGFGYVLIFAVKGFSWLSILFCLAFSVFIVISVIDFRTYEIPPALNLCILVLGIVRLLIYRSDYMEFIIGFVAVSGFMLVLLILGRLIAGVEAFGGGDIKLMAAAGLLLGVKEIILAFIIGCILGAVIHSVRMRVSDEENVLAFGPYLCMGLTIAMLFGKEMIDWYFGFFI